MEGMIVPDVVSPSKKGNKSGSSSGDVEYANSFRISKKRPEIMVSEEDDAKVHATAADPIFRLGRSASP